ncbi:MAG: hypothetical protein ACFFAE_10225 [Candidatus Hodarchaeota archaeon]
MSELLNQAQEVTNYLVNKTEEVDLIYLFGGVAQGREHSRSDLEMVAVSKEKLIRWEFILNERPIFIWPQSWKQLENIAAGRQDYWSVAGASIAHGKILWSKSEEKKDKFLKIQRKVKTGAKVALKRAVNSFDGLYGKLWRIQKALETERKKDTPFLIWDLVKEIVNILATLNDRFLQNNWGTQINELQGLKKVPENFIERYRALITSEPVKTLHIASDLVDDVNVLLKKWMLENQGSTKKEVEEIVTDWPTVLEFQNKAIIATEQEDLIKGLFAAQDNAWFNLWAFTALRNINWNRTSFFSASKESEKLPNDIRDNLTVLLESRDLSKIQKATDRLAEQLRAELEKKGWRIPECSSLEEAYKFLRVY